MYETSAHRWDSDKDPWNPAIAPRPTLNFQKIAPSLSVMTAALEKLAGRGFKATAAGPFPCPPEPWHAAQVVVKICFPTAIVSAFPASGFLFAEADAGGTHGGGFPASDEASCAMKTANAITIPPREGLDMCRLY